MLIDEEKLTSRFLMGASYILNRLATNFLYDGFPGSLLNQ
jgi:hypothetical protein